MVITWGNQGVSPVVLTALVRIAQPWEISGIGQSGDWAIGPLSDGRLMRWGDFEPLTRTYGNKLALLLLDDVRISNYQFLVSSFAFRGV